MASSKRSARPAKSSGTTSRARRTTSTSSRTRSTSSTTTTEPVVIALGSNLGDRAWHLRRAIHELGAAMRVVRVSSIHETDPVAAPPGSPKFLNMVVAGWTSLKAEALLEAMHVIEAAHGRVRRRRNEPRPLDLDLILYGAHVLRTSRLSVPHPRYLQRAFVVNPLRELRLGWRDPVSGTVIG